MIYVMSDLHGRYEHFLDMLEFIKFSDEDTLYILGDIIDRGPRIIDIVNYVMATPNIKMILGNHEKMMLDYYATKSSYDKSLWYSNGGDATDKEFKLLSLEEQDKILKFFSELPIEYNLEINNKKYNLVHGIYIDKEMKDSYTEKEYREHILWGRVRKWDIGPKDCVAIFGHTCTGKFMFTNGKYSIWKKDNLIGIDCGLAGYDYWPNLCRLGCLCLDTMEEFYV